MQEDSNVTPPVLPSTSTSATESQGGKSTKLALPITLVVAGILAIVVGFVAPFLVVFQSGVTSRSSSPRITVPGSVTFVAESDDVLVHLEHHSTINGVTTAGPRSLPSLNLTATDSDGNLLPIDMSPSMSSYYELPSHAGAKIATIRATEGDTLEVNATAPGFTGQGTPVLAFSPGLGPSFFGVLLSMMLVTMLSSLVGFVLLIAGTVVLIVRLVRRV